MKREPYAVLYLSLLCDKYLNGRDIRVYAALSTFADGAGRCFPSREEISKRCNVETPHVSRHTAKLAKHGYLVIERTGKRKTNHYTLKGDATQNGASLKRDDAPQNGASDDTQNGASSIHTHLTIPQERKKAMKTQSPVTAFKDFWSEAYFEKTGSQYVWSHAKEAAIIKGLLEDIDIEDLKARSARFLKMRDTWLKENGHTIANLRGRINKPDVVGRSTAKECEDFGEAMNARTN